MDVSCQIEILLMNELAMRTVFNFSQRLMYFDGQLKRLIMLKCYIVALICMGMGSGAKKISDKKQGIIGDPNKGTEITSLTDLFATKDDKGTTYNILGCTVRATSENRLWTFIPSKECQEKLSLGIVFDFLTTEKTKPKVETLMNLTRSIFPPGAFVLTKLIVNKETGDVEFACSSTDSFFVIKDKLKIMKNGNLELKFNYKRLRSNFSFSQLDIVMRGQIEIAQQVMGFGLIKKANSTESSFSIKAEQIIVSEFAKIFSANETKPLNASEITNTQINQPIVNGKRGEDGSYEIVAKGEVIGLVGIDKISGFLVIQKPADSFISVGVVLSIKQIQPLKILSKLTGKDLMKIPLLKDLSLDLSIEYANGNLSSLKDETLNDALSKYTEDGKIITEGTKIKFDMPIKRVLKKFGTVANLENIPEKIKCKIVITSEKVSWIFPEDLVMDLFNILAAITPKAFELIQTYVFKTPPRIVVKKYDVNVKTNEVELGIAIPDEILLGTEFLSIQNGYLEVKHDLVGSVHLIINATLKIAGATLQVFIANRKNVFHVIGNLSQLTSKQIMKEFAGEKLAEETVAKNKKLDFGIKNLQIEAVFGENVEQLIRIIGTPVLFDWSGLTFEAYMLKGASLDARRESRQIVRKERQSSHERKMALAVVMQNVRIDQITDKLFGKNTERFTNWMVNLDFGLIVSSTGENRFTIPQIKNVERGIFVTGELGFPKDCMKNSLCVFAKEKMKEDAKLFIQGGIKEEGLVMKLGYQGDAFDLTQRLRLNALYFQLIVGESTEFGLKGRATLQVKGQSPLAFEVLFGLQASSAIKLSGQVDGMWRNPSFSIGNLELTAALQPLLGFAPEHIAVSGQFELGKENTSIKVQAAGKLSLINPLQNFFYGKATPLTLQALSDAYDHDIILPKPILQSGFPKGLYFSFSTSPKKITIPNFDAVVKLGFNMKGTINILGYEVSAVIHVSKTIFQVEAYLDPIDIFDGAFVLTRSATESELGAVVQVKLGYKEAQCAIRGNLEVLGIQSDNQIDISNKGIFISMQGDFLGLFSLNLTVVAPFSVGQVFQLNGHAFQVSSCISAEIYNATEEANNVVSDATDSTRAAMGVVDEEEKKHLSWYGRIVKKLQAANTTLQRIQSKIDVYLQKLEGYKEIMSEGYCTEKCKDETYSDWYKCMAKCSLKKISAGVKSAYRGTQLKAREIQYSLYKKTVNRILDIDSNVKGLMDKAEHITKSVKSSMKKGVELLRSVGDKIKHNFIEIHHACFNTSLEKASGACFDLDVSVTLLGKTKKSLNSHLCFTGGFMKSLGDAISEKLFPGVSEMSTQMKNVTEAYIPVDAELEEVELHSEISKEELKQLSDLEDEVDEFFNLDQEGEGEEKKKSSVPTTRRSDTMERFNKLLYNEFPTLSRHDGDLLATTLELTSNYVYLTHHRKDMPIDVAALTRTFDLTLPRCQQEKHLVNSYQQITNQLGSFTDRLSAEKIKNKEEGEQLEKLLKDQSADIMALCRRFNMSMKVTEEAAERTSQIVKAHQRRMRNLDSDYDVIEQETINTWSRSFAKYLQKDGKLTLERFLGKLGEVTAMVSSGNKENAAYFQNAFEAVRNLIRRPSLNQKRSVGKLRYNLSLVKRSIFCDEQMKNLLKSE